jgi:hypothetical protein
MVSDTYSDKKLPADAVEEDFAPHNRYVSVNWLSEA